MPVSSRYICPAAETSLSTMRLAPDSRAQWAQQYRGSNNISAKTIVEEIAGVDP